MTLAQLTQEILLETAKFQISTLNKLNSKVQIRILFVATILINCWNVFPIFKGNIFGDPFDARLQIVLHEHWWRWLNGLVEFRDTEFFYPFKLGLGFSDNFLFQGLIHSIFRYIGFSILNSWVITNILILFIGNLGWIFLARNIFKHFLNKFLFILIINFNIHFLSYYIFQVNTVGYLYISWFLFLYSLKFNRLIFKVYAIITYLVLYSLISWYAFFFLIIFLIILFIIRFINQDFRIKVRNKISSLKNNFNLFEFVFFTLLNGILISIFIYIYFPVRNSPSRTIDELIYGSLEFKNIFNVPKSLIQNLVHFDKLTSQDFRQNGLNILLILLLIFVILIQNKFNKTIYFELKILISSLIFLFYFLNLSSDFTIYKYFYLYVPGFDSIRYTHRSIIFLSQILIIVFFKILDKKYLKFNKNEMTLLYIFLLPIFALSQIHPQWNGWNKEILENKDLKMYANKITTKCDYFYFDAPGGWWYDQIEAMYFAYKVGVPTVNGYSGGFPIGYPYLNFNEMNESKQIFTWISKISETEKGCYITGKTPLYELKSKMNRIDKVGLIEKSKNLYLSTTPYPYIYVFTELNRDYNLNFKVKNNDCNSDNILSYKLGEDNQYKKIKMQKNNQEINIVVNSQNSRVHRIIFSSNAEKCLVEDTATYFYLSDFNLISN